MRRITFFIAVLWAVGVFAPGLPGAQLKTVRLAYTGVSEGMIPNLIAHRKGFYKEQGLDVVDIAIRGSLGVKALIGGSVDYSTASGSTTAAALRGLGVKLTYIVSAKPSFHLIAHPSIRSVKDLKGKSIGISSRGAPSSTCCTRSWRSMGSSPTRMSPCSSRADLQTAWPP